MADEQVGHAHPLLQLLQHVDHLGLYGHVQRRDGFVADHEFGPHGQGPGDADALALAPGELVGVAVQVVLLQADLPDQLRDPGFDLRLGHLLQPHRLGDDAGDGHPGVQRGVGVLEDHLHFAPPGLNGLFVQRRDVGAPVEDLPPGGPVQPHQRPPDGGLAAAGFAHQAEGLAGVQLEGHVVHGLQLPAPPEQVVAHGEIHLQGFDFDQGLGHGQSSLPIFGAFGCIRWQATLWVSLSAVTGGMYARQTGIQ